MPPTFGTHIVYRQARAEHAETRATAGGTGNIYMITDHTAGSHGLVQDSRRGFVN